MFWPDCLSTSRCLKVSPCAAFARAVSGLVGVCGWSSMASVIVLSPAAGAEGISGSCDMLSDVELSRRLSCLSLLPGEWSVWSDVMRLDHQFMSAS